MYETRFYPVFGRATRQQVTCERGNLKIIKDEMLDFVFDKRLVVFYVVEDNEFLIKMTDTQAEAVRFCQQY